MDTIRTEDTVRHIQHLVPLALVGASLSCAVPAAAAALPPDAAEQSAPAEQPTDTANVEKTPRFEFWGDYRWLYGKARMELPSVKKRQDV